MKFLVKLLISLTALYFVIQKVDTRQIAHLYRQSEISLFLPAIVFFVLSKMISAYRLNQLFQRTGVHLSEAVNLKLYWMGMYYNIFLPGGVGGDAYKIYLLKKHLFQRTRKLFSAILVDRANGLFVLLLMSSVLFAFVLDSTWFSVSLILLVPLSYLVYMAIMQKWFSDFQAFMHKINVYSLLVQFAQLLMVIFLLLSWDISNNYLIYLSVFLISSVIAILPVSIGGAGAREVTFLFFSKYLPFDLNTAIALSLMFYLITLLVSFGGIIYTIRPIRFN